MRLVLVILVLVAVGFALTIGLGVSGGSGPGDGSNGAPPTKANGEVDEDRLEDWQPPSLADGLNSLLSPFAPGLELAQPHVALAAGSTGNRAVPRAGDDMRIARLRLTQGLGAVVTATCLPAKGRTCPQSACLCRPGAVVDESVVGACPEPWRKARRGGDGRIRCRDDDDEGRLIAYPEGGALQATPLGNGGADLDIR